jgi:hypothetical protein
MRHCKTHNNRAERRSYTIPFLILVLAFDTPIPFWVVEHWKAGPEIVRCMSERSEFTAPGPD